MSKDAPTHENMGGTPPGTGLLATKLYARPARADLVPRPRITRLLDAGLSASLILVSAPAGFGKTTLLAAWLADRPQRSAWLTLDTADNDHARFLSYVLAALQVAVPGVASDLVAPLRSPQPPSAEAVVTVLVNELAPLSNPVILVLDDYHAITSPAVNSAVAYLLEHLPPSLHLVIATRSDPPLPIARLRARGQVVEVRADDLRFTPDEAAAFLNQTMGLALSPEQVAALDERAEGWIAGLQMAALSMRGREDVDDFIRAFAGTHRFIMDYLLEEVLAREPEEVQAFLLQTAILTRLSGPLCDAVTGGSGAQEMLEGLERRNLFVVPLDDQRRWYRYHHLFADLLQARIHQSGPDRVAGLYSRAAEWCEGEGLTAEAVGYALAARDYRRVATLVAGYWPYALANGEIATVWSWLEAVPEDVVRNSALLGVTYCWLLWFKGQVGAIEAHLGAAERALSELPVPKGPSAADDNYSVVPALLAALRSTVARYHGDFDAARAHAERALGLVPENLPPLANARLHALILMMLTAAYEGPGDLERAAEAYAETARLSRLGKSASGLVGAIYRMTAMLRVLGRLREAGEACREALRFVEEQAMARLPAVGLLHVVMGELLLEHNDLQAAEAHLSRGAELGRWSGRMDAVKNAAPALARLRQARNDASGALAAVEEAEAALDEPVPPLAKAELLALKARILVRQGSLAAAARCVEEAERLGGRDRGSTGEMVALAACRVHLAQCTPAEAAAELSRSLAAAEEAGRLGTALELRILRSLALARQGDTQAARADLQRALALAEPEGYVRLFVDEGEPMAQLLRELRELTEQKELKGPEAPSLAYVTRLLLAFPVPGAVAAGSPVGSVSSPGSLSSPSPLVEPLSERELQVLRLMAEGLTNQQIAARLIVALGTVKAHVHNISGKLGAQNRAHAVARARELGLL